MCFFFFRGLLGGHFAALALKNTGKGMSWYNNELVAMAKEIGYRLLPAFNTTTGIPYPRVSFSLLFLMHFKNLNTVHMSWLYFVLQCVQCCKYIFAISNTPQYTLTYLCINWVSHMGTYLVFWLCMYHTCLKL